ncbi:MAG: L-lactate dehydrogenase [Candidatus Altimarinota bacterium]
MLKTLAPQSNFQSQFKVSIVGCGNVGATAAYAMLLDGTPTELVLLDHSKERAEGLLLDFVHSLSFLPYTKITASDDYNACSDSQLIFITAGAKQQEGETRLQLIEKNRKVFQDIIPKIAKIAPQSILVIVTNPVDILTYEAIQLSGFPKNRVFGTGTMLDTARLQFHIGEKLSLNPHSIQAYVLGEHGDTSFPAFSSANVAGKSLFEFEGFTKEVAAQCYDDTKNAAYRIIHDIGYTCYSIATVMREIMKHIYQNSRVVLPLSVLVEDYYEQSNIALSIPCVLDSKGIAETIKIPLNTAEQEQFIKSVETLKKCL